MTSFLFILYRVDKCLDDGWGEDAKLVNTNRGGSNHMKTRVFRGLASFGSGFGKGTNPNFISNLPGEYSVITDDTIYVYKLEEMIEEDVNSSAAYPN